MSPAPKVGIFVPLDAKLDKQLDVKNFLEAGRGLLDAEPLTLQWYAFKYEGGLKPVYAIFDTFAGEEGRQAHLTGKIAEALMANATALLSTPPAINKVEILVSKVEKGDVKLGLRVLAEAKPDKVQTVKEFLISALPLAQAETLTPQWFAVQFHDESGPTSKFGIFDFSETEEGRQAHLNGQIAAALFSKADEFFVKTPEVVKVDVVASRVLL